MSRRTTAAATALCAIGLAVGIATGHLLTAVPCLVGLIAGLYDLVRPRRAWTCEACGAGGRAYTTRAARSDGQTHAIVAHPNRRTR